MLRHISLAVAVLLALLALVPATAQTSGGTLVGETKDESGAALPGVTVTATNNETGFNRSSVTGPDGVFRFIALPIGDYTVTAELSGFSTVTVENVRVIVATERTLSITMQLATIQEAITVVDSEPLIQTTPSVGTVVSQEELENLPLNGRQFANLGTLAAGTTLSVNPDPTKPGQLTIALNGGIGRNVNYLVDGGDNMDDTIGGALQGFNLEAVQEFKIQTSQYKAEYGRSTGGVLSVVTKTGTNQFSGSAYGFFRNDSLNTKTESEKLAGIDKQSFERDQYGASLGGPIVKDKAHFFATYEKTKRDTNYTVLTGGLFPQFDGQSTPLPFTDELITAKATLDTSAKQFLQLRYGYQKNSDKYGASPSVTPDSLGTLTNEYESILGSHTTQIGADSLNEFVVQYSTFKNLILADSNNPTIYFPSGVRSGQNPNSPQSTTQEKRQIKDVYSFSRDLGGDRHDFKAGIEYIDEPDLGGDFPFGSAGLFTRLSDDPNSPVTDITFFGGSFQFSTPNKQWRFFFQDDWQVNDRLTLNLGVRYEYTDVLELDQRANPIWQVLSTQTQFNDPYLRDFQGGRGGKINPDKNDVAPRLGFVWDMKGDGKQLLRGGIGRFYDFPYTNATVLFPAAAVQSNFGQTYNYNDPNGILNPNGTFFQPGDPLPPNQLPPSGDPVPNEVASPTLATPYSDQISLSYSNQVTPWLGINVDLISIDYRDIPFRFRANPLIDTNGDGVGDQRRFPQFGNFRVWSGDGEADYDALNVGVRGRLSDSFEFQGFYTLSRAEGNVLAGADEFRITDTGHQPELAGSARDASIDPTNPLCSACFGPLNTDARHRVTLSGVYRAPLGFTVAGIFRYRSALPYTVHAGTDLNGDGFNFDLAPGVSHVNSARGASFSQFDVRVSKEFNLSNRVGLELIAEVFNLFNEKNPALFVGARNSANFGQATTFAGDPLQGEQRLLQLGARLRF